MSKNNQVFSEIRQDYFSEKRVIITPGRAKRPRDIKEETVIKRTGHCPFCPENLGEDQLLDRIDDEAGQWVSASIRNIFPAVTLDNDQAYGVQEVIIEARDHAKELAELDEKAIEGVLRLYARRTEAIAKNPKIDYILCFKNQGSKAGASIVHAHSQVFATQILPSEVKAEQEAAKRYQAERGSCAYCDIIKAEMKTERKIFEDGLTAAFCPYASQYHYETWIFSQRHLDNITKLNDKEFRSFAAVLKNILVKLQSLDLSYNFFLHQVVSDSGQHFCLKIQPRDSVWAGIELGSGLVINSVPPEEAAEYYREGGC